MKLIEIDETETQLVFTVHGSKVSRIAPKADATSIQSALAEIMAEAPETRPREADPEPEPEAAHADEDDAVASLGEVFETIGQLLNSEGGRRARGMLEKLPKARRRGAASGG